MSVYNSVGKGTSGIDKFGSVIDRMNMKLGSKVLKSLRTKTQLLKGKGKGYTAISASEGS
jgi:hypothetical protein